MSTCPGTDRELRSVRAGAPLIPAFGMSGTHYSALYNHPFALANLAASTRFAAPILLIASDR
jgi:hypothetical protein